MGIFFFPSPFSTKGTQYISASEAVLYAEESLPQATVTPSEVAGSQSEAGPLVPTKESMRPDTVHSDGPKEATQNAWEPG